MGARPLRVPTVKGRAGTVDNRGTMRLPYTSRFDSYPMLRAYGRRTRALLAEALALGVLVGAMAVAVFY